MNGQAHTPIMGSTMGYFRLKHCYLALLLMIAPHTTTLGQAQAPALQWLVQSASPEWDNLASAMATDSEGNILIALDAAEEFNFAGTAIPFVNLTGDFAVGSVLFKLSPTGELIWHRSLKGPMQEWAWCGGIDTDSDNNIYVSYAGWSSVENATTIGGMYAISSQAQDHFLVKISPDGEGLWYTVGNMSPGTFSSISPRCKVGPDGVYMYGPLTTSANFGGYNMSNTGTTRAYLIKHDLNGNVLWGSVVGNTLGSVVSGGLEVDHNGNAYASGFWQGNTLQVGPLSIENDLAFTGNRDRWICKWAADGTAQWLRREHSSGNEGRSNLALNAAGELTVLSHKEEGQLFIGDAPITGAGLVLSRYNDAGEVMAGTLLAAYDTEYWIRPPAAVYTPDGGYLVCGSFDEPSLTIGGINVANAGGNAGTSDAYIARIGPDNQAEWVYTIGSTEAEEARYVNSSSPDHFTVAGSHYGVGMLIQGEQLLPASPFIGFSFLASFSTALSTRTAQAMQELLAYPNPFTENVQLDAQALQLIPHAELSIYNMQGAEVYRGKPEALVPVQLGHLPKGSYIARMSDGTRSLHTKIIKQ